MENCADSYPDCAALTAYLHEKIPLTEAMQLEVCAATPEILRLFLPLEPNHNHQGTGFGGSLTAAATVAAWTGLYARLQSMGLDGVIVVSRSSCEFLAPVTADFYVEAPSANSEAWGQFVATLQQRGRASLSLTAEIVEQKRVALTFEGQFHVRLIDAPQGA